MPGLWAKNYMMMMPASFKSNCLIYFLDKKTLLILWFIVIQQNGFWFMIICGKLIIQIILQNATWRRYLSIFYKKKSAWFCLTTIDCSHIDKSINHIKLAVFLHSPRIFSKFGSQLEVVYGPRWQGSRRNSLKTIRGWILVDECQGLSLGCLKSG